MIRQPIRVQVMESAISWPERCACCNGPADMRFTGTHAPASDSSQREWEVPYCFSCVEHVRVTHQAEAVKLGLLNKTPPVALSMALPLRAALSIGIGAGATGGLFVSTFIMGLLQLPAWLIMVVVVTACAYIGSMIALYLYKRQAKKLQLRNLRNQLLFDNKVQELLMQAHDINGQALALTRKTCGAIGPAVAYEGGSDGRHQFLIWNTTYALQFVNAINRSVLSPAQTAGRKPRSPVSC